MPMREVLVALVVSALAADAQTVGRMLERIAREIRRRWKKHKRE